MEARLQLVPQLLADIGSRLLQDCGLGGQTALEWLLLTDPRVHDQERLTVFVYGPRATEPAAVIKIVSPPGESPASVPATPGGEPHLAPRGTGPEQEWLALSWLAHCAPELSDRSVPAPLGQYRWEGRDIFMQSYLPGRSLFVELSRHLAPCLQVRVHFQMATRWLARFHLATRRQATLDPAGLERLAVGQSAGARHSASIVSSRDRLMSILARTPVPLSAGHGDYWLRNVLALANGGTGVVDWEQFEVSSLPTDDLFFFPLTYGLAYPWSGPAGRRPREAIRRTFLEDTLVSRRVQRYLLDYCSLTGILPEALEPLFVVFLLSRAAELPGPAGLWLDLAEEISATPNSVFRR
jgi:hypothetical protein